MEDSHLVLVILWCYILQKIFRQNKNIVTVSNTTSIQEQISKESTKLVSILAAFDGSTMLTMLILQTVLDMFRQVQTCLDMSKWIKIIHIDYLKCLKGKRQYFWHLSKTKNQLQSTTLTTDMFASEDSSIQTMEAILYYCRHVYTH